MSSLPHGPASDGPGQPASVPVLAMYRGRVWSVWADPDGQVWYSHTGSSGGGALLAPPQRFPQTGRPVMVSLNGVLHVIVVQAETGQMAHFVHDDDDASAAWTSLGALDAAAGFVAHSTPAVIDFHNKIFLAFLRDGQLHCAVWAALGGDDAERWTAPVRVAGADTRFRGIPMLSVIQGVLHVLCDADTEERHVLGFRFDDIRQTWAQSDDVSKDRADYFHLFEQG